MSGDENQRELVRKVTRLVDSKFGGDWSRAFQHYSRSGTGDGLIDDGELRKLLSDASVGNSWTRGTWARKIIEKIDGDGDRKISWEEFRAGVR